jgi:hypothetical protein
MRFPKTVRYRKGVVKIYAKKKNYPYYRIAYWAEGKRHFANFAKYADARKAAEAKAKEISQGHAGAALTSAQARDALNAFQILDSHRQAGMRLTLTNVVSEFVELSKKLGAHTFREAVERFLTSLATVIPKTVQLAVKEFLDAADARSKAGEGQRPQLSSKYAYNRRLQLQKFAKVFGHTPVSDLTKAQLDLFIAELGKLGSDSHNGKKAVSAKSRNHYRAVIRQFLSWAVRKDYLQTTHRLGEADGLRPENANTSEVRFYTPAEFSALLDTATGDLASLRPIIAIGGFPWPSSPSPRS